MEKKSIVENSINGLIHYFHKHNINYAILNNYKILPYIKNDLDILTLENHKTIIKILKKIKKDFKWDKITYCRNLETPGFTEQSVETFNLYKKKNFYSLNIDFVRGVIVSNGVILKRTLDLLNKKKIYKKRYFHLREEDENIIKILSLSQNIKSNKFQLKKYKYLLEILKKTNKKSFKMFLIKNNLELLNKPLSELRKKNYRNFYFGVENFRKKIFLKTLYKRPFLTIINIFFRLKIRILNRLVIFLNKSKIININILKDSDERKVKKILSNLYKIKLFRNIEYLKSKIILNQREVSSLNSGGVLVKFGSNLENAININNLDSDLIIKKKIFNYVVKMNTIVS